MSNDFNNRLWFFFWCFIVLFMLSGCTQYNNLKIKFFGNVTQTNITTVENECQCPVCNCGAEFEAVIYYFDKEIESGINKFIEEADTYLYCSFTRLDSTVLNDALTDTYFDIDDVKIIFDEASTMDCSAACVPYSSSQYNELYSEGLDIKTRKNVHNNFCVSEDGLFITSKTFDDNQNSDFGMFFKSKELRDLFQERFNNKWGA